MKQSLKEKFTWQKIDAFVYPVGVGILLFILWETEQLHKILNTDSYILPVPSRIFQIILDNSEKIMLNTQATLTVALWGLLIGSLLGYFIAIIATFFPVYGAGGLTIVSAFNAVPIVALAPVISNWTKSLSDDASVRSMIAKIIVVVILCTASMSVNAFRGLNEVKPFSEDLMKSYACNKMIVLFKLRFPNSIPYIFIALRVSVPASVITALVSEYFAEYVIGVGRQIRESILIAQYASAWSYIAVACVMGVVLYGLLIVAESICLKNRKR